MSQTMIIMTAALGAELVLLLIVALSVAYLRNRAARQRDRAAIQALVARVRQERPQREQAIAQFLGTRLGYQGSDLSDNATLLARAEVKLLHRFALLYRDRDADLAGRFDGELNAMLDAYHALAAATIAAPVTESTQPAVDDAELEFLRRENTRLSDELRITMETMSRMLNEYSTMFAPVAEPEGIEPRETAFDEPLDAAAGFSDAAEVDVAAAAHADQSDDGDWEVAVDTAGQGSSGDEGDWEVAVDVAEPAGDADADDWEVAADTGPAGAVLADEAGAEPIASAPPDPLEEIMRAAQNQERSARGAAEAAGAFDAPVADKTAKARPEPDVEEDLDLFDVVVEGTPTKMRTDPEPAFDATEDSGDDLFDVVEAPRSRSAS